MKFSENSRQSYMAFLTNKVSEADLFIYLFFHKCILTTKKDDNAELPHGSPGRLISSFCQNEKKSTLKDEKK